MTGFQYFAVYCSLAEKANSDLGILHVLALPTAPTYGVCHVAKLIVLKYFKKRCLWKVRPAPDHGFILDDKYSTNRTWLRLAADGCLFSRKMIKRWETPSANLFQVARMDVRMTATRAATVSRDIMRHLDHSPKPVQARSTVEAILASNWRPFQSGLYALPCTPAKTQSMVACGCADGARFHVSCCWSGLPCERPVQQSDT